MIVKIQTVEMGNNWLWEVLSSYFFISYSMMNPSITAEQSMNDWQPCFFCKQFTSKIGENYRIVGGENDGC